MFSESKYREIFNPRNFIKNFESDYEFGEWLVLGSYEDLKYTLEAFEKEEMFEHCAIIKKVMDKVKELEA